ncbi:hypothetical protein SAMN05519104_5181 [Rhizobiales bacterium GAS188]|nr:hypothetical protein SAMN05519104_5181 [Rhizobiales bacterium GAS188]
MLAEHPTIARPSRTNRSKVTNGTRMLAGIDGRSEQGRRYRDLMRSFASDIGGLQSLNESEMAMVRQAAALTAQSERMQADVVNDAGVDAEQLTRLLNSQKRALGALETIKRRRLAQLAPRSLSEALRAASDV